MTKPDHFRETEKCCDCEYLGTKSIPNLEPLTTDWCMLHDFPVDDSEFVFCYNWSKKYD